MSRDSHPHARISHRGVDTDRHDDRSMATICGTARDRAFLRHLPALLTLAVRIVPRQVRNRDHCDGDNVERKRPAWH
jgi:hypothetical protein